MRKIKCWIVQLPGTKLLVCNEPTKDEDYVYSSKYNTWGKRFIYCSRNDENVFKVIAWDIRNHRSHIVFFPEFVMEAYSKGIREFYVEMKTKTVITEELVYGHLGLLKVTYDEPKKQNFTREDMIRLGNAFAGVHIDTVSNWIDKHFS